MAWIIILVIVVILILVGVAFYAANFFLNVALFRNNEWYQKKGHEMMNPDNFNKGQSKYDVTEELQLADGSRFWEQEFAEDRWLEVGGETLYARMFMPYPESSRWVICVHGYRSYGKRDMSYVASRFAEEGYNVLVPDLRAHGESSGNVIGMGWLDRLDLLSWISEILSIDYDAEIVLMGGSMGAASVMMTSGEKLPKNVKGFVVDCGYTSVYDEFKTMLKSAFNLPAFPIITIANHLSLRKAGFRLKDASAVRQLQKNYLPTLFIHGTGDKFVPHEMLYKNLEASKGIKESLVVERAPHLSSFIYEPEHYFSTVFEFLERYCQ